MNRRNFLKGSLAAVALVAVPVVAKKEEAVEIDYLGNWGDLHAVCRKPGECDDELRKRILDKRKPMKAFTYNGNPFQIEVM